MKVLGAREIADLIPDGATVTVSSSSGLGCPDAVLEAIGARFAATGHPRGLTTLHPIAAGDMYSVKGIDHLARPGLLERTLCGSYPSGPSSAEPPAIWRMIGENAVAAYNVPSGILFDMHREAAAKRPGVLTKVGLDTFVDPAQEGCAMNPAAAARPIVRRERFAGEDWLFFPAIAPDVAIIRATTADERGNLTFEHEGAFLGTPRPGARGPQHRRHGDRPGEAARAFRARSSPRTCASPASSWTSWWWPRISSRPPGPSTTRPSPARSSAPSTASASRSTRCRR